MKKSYFILLTIIGIVVSCNQLSIEESNLISESTIKYSPNRSLNEAIEIAQNAAKNFFDNYQTKNTNNTSRVANLKNIKYYISTKTKAYSNDTLMYIINFEDNNGFALVGTNRNYPELIAIIERGSYNGSKTGNPGFDIYIDEVSKRLKTIPNSSGIGGGQEIIAWEYRDEITDDINSINEPLVPVKWHQNPPYNKYCPPGCPTGCVATAVALAMTAFKYPASTDLTFNNSPTNFMTISWNNITQSTHNNKHDDSCQYCDHIALLQRELGHRMNMKYDPNGSGTITEKYVPKCLNSLGYHCDSYQPYNINEVLSSLDKHYPVIIRARNDADKGHTWIIDGSKFSYKRVDTYRRNVHINEPWEHCNYHIDQLKYVHMNYGWGNQHIGYYLAEKYIKAEGVRTAGLIIDSYDIKIFTGEKGFDNEVFIIPDIHIGN